MLRRVLLSSSPLLCFLSASLALGACGGSQPAPACPNVASSASAMPLASASAGAPTGAPGATPDDAKAFVAKLESDLRRVYVAQSRAEWVYENFITDDTEALTTKANAASGEYLTREILDARRFDPIRADLPADVSRQLGLLKLTQTVPAPTEAADRDELASIQAQMTGIYGKGKYCSPRWNGKCLKIDEMTSLGEHAKTYDELLDEWQGWHDQAKPMRAKFERFVELGNEGAKEIGFADMGALWRSGYDMSADDFAADVDRLWAQVKPLYDALHCYVRSQLQKEYGKDKVPDHAPIPAHLLGNMWAQSWGDLLDVLTPYKGEPSLDASKNLKAQHYDSKKMTKTAESFFTSLGFDPLPQTFWDRSLFTRPEDRDVVCHASAWDVGYDDDLRVKVCLTPTEEDLLTIHHELGHDFYFQSYYKLPILFQQGANDGFHEGIGDTIALSVTPQYLKDRGLIDALPHGDHGRINTLMKRALEKIAFLPFGLVIDKWRWDVFSGKIPPSSYNASWWSLRAQYQGIAPAVPRGEDDFDPGAKYHIASSTPYIRYFLAFIYQFQFHRALCKAAGYTGPLDACSIYGNKDAGAKLKAMLAMGASQPWQQALAALSGETQADASAILDYFAPLKQWLDDQNKGATCGW